MEPPPSHPSLEGFPVVVHVAVSWGDMDAFAHVNNAIFFRYFEDARIEYLVRIGFSSARAVGPILASTHCRYRRPLTYPDQLLVGVRTTEVSDDRFTIEYRLVSDRLNTVAAEGSGVVVSYDYEKAEKTALPPNVRQAIADLEGWSHGSPPE